MDRALYSIRGLPSLFAEDFDRPPVPPAPPEPEVIEPVFTAAEVEAAREAAWRDGHEAGLDEAAAADTAICRDVLAEIAGRLTTARDEASAVAEQAAEAVAHLLLDCFATAFPALVETYADSEVGSVIAQVLPALHQDPHITVRLAPAAQRCVTQLIERLDPTLPSRVQIVPTDAIPPGDVRISWTNGSAVRDTADLWRQIAEVLAPAGLLPTRQAAAKEIERVE